MKFALHDRATQSWNLVIIDYKVVRWTAQLSFELMLRVNCLSTATVQTEACISSMSPESDFFVNSDI